MTPKQIENLIETCGGDTEMVDGYDELPAEFQEKVQFALENGHVPDEDWKYVSYTLDINFPEEVRLTTMSEQITNIKAILFARLDFFLSTYGFTIPTLQGANLVRTWRRTGQARMAFV